MIKYFFKTSLILLATFLFFLGIWLKDNFGEVSADQVLYHLQYHTENTQAVVKYKKSFIFNCLIPTGAFSLILFFGLNISLTNSKPHRLLNFYIIPFFFTLLSFFYISNHHFFLSYFYSYKYKNYISKLYISPDNIQPPNIKKNLIIIYIESLESGYKNPILFKKNLLSNLNFMDINSISFEEYKQTSGTGWTIAGIFSSLCGVPLRPKDSWFPTEQYNNKKIAIDGNELLTQNQAKKFMPNIKCLGDILKKNGYTNIFLGGANQDFAGKGNFFKTHGYEEVWGATEWSKTGSTRFNEWGIYDDELFEKAKSHLITLYKNRQPFNLTILTLDTHHPSGYVNDFCLKKGIEHFDEIVECSVEIVSDFVNFALKNDLSKNTDIVILGDHLAFNSSPSIFKLKKEKRSIYNLFLSHTLKVPNTKKILHYDIYPTILSMLDFKVPLNRVALGSSAFGERDSNINLFDEKELDLKLEAPDYIYKKFWSQ